MSELAFNMNGEPFEVPSTATGWRVRRMKHKGPPEVVYGKDGTPLVLPIDADADDLRREVGEVAGRYRVDAVEGHRSIPNTPAGYVYIHPSDEPAVALRGLPPASESVVIEAMRMNAEIARAVVDRFPMLLEAAATLLRAADGAGLPARAPIALATDEEPESDGDDEREARPGVDLSALVAQLAPMLLAGFASGKAKLPSIAEMLDWRKAAASAKPAAAEPAPASTLPADAMERVTAVLAQLTTDERALAMAMAKELSTEERTAWFAELAPLPVADAVARVRAVLGTKKEPPQ